MFEQSNGSPAEIDYENLDIMSVRTDNQVRF